MNGKSGGGRQGASAKGEGSPQQSASIARSLMARERLELLFDPGAALDERPYLQAEPLAASWPVLTAVGPVHGITVCAVMQDVTTTGRGLDDTHWRQMQLAMEYAHEHALPLVAVFDGSLTQVSGGLRAWDAITRAVASAATSAAPKLALLIGENSGFSALLASLFDVIVMTRTGSALTLTDAVIANRVTHADLTEAELGGWKVHAEQTGLADLVCDNEVMGIRAMRRVLQHCVRSAGRTNVSSGPLSYRPGLDTLLPEQQTQSYDVRELLRELTDTRSFLELGADLRSSVVVGLAQVGGFAMGFVASQNQELAGALDTLACRKAARHIRLCQALCVPIVTVVDVPGFVPGFEQESGGLAVAVAQLLQAYNETSVPKITVVVGKAYGAAGVALGSRATRPYRIASWRGTQLGLLGEEGIRRLAALSGDDTAQGVAMLETGHALLGGHTDAVLEPGETRQWLGKTVAMACQSSYRRT